MLGITDYLWRLVPANPILLRVVQTGGKRRRDLFIRCGYLGLLIGFVLFSLLTSGTASGASSLDELTKTSFALFKSMSYIQLALVALLAPIFTAGAITQEKDGQTYDILLSTPLTNGQIVLGSLLSRLFFVVALLVSGIPVFSITQIFGGVAIGWIAQSFLIAAATAFVTGAMAMAIATFKVGTRRTIFNFYFFIVLYLVGLALLDAAPASKVALADGTPSTTSWLTGLHPFLALRSIFNARDYTPPDMAALPPELQAWPVGWMLTSPAGFYTALMFTLSLVLVLPSIVLLRRMAQTTVGFKGWLLQTLRLSKGDRTRKPRYVWSNPIAWREARTKASAARATFIRYGFIVGGVGLAAWGVTRFATVVEPREWVNAQSYDPSSRTFTVYGETGAKHFQVTGAPAVSISDAPGYGNRQPQAVPTSLERIDQMYAVGTLTTAGAGAGKIVTGLVLHPVQRRMTEATARSFLMAAVVVEFAIVLLIVTNAAASTVTREKEDGSLDLLLATPITSRYYIWGKLRGLVSFVLPLVAVPVVSVLLFVVYDFYRLAGTGAAAGAVAPIVFWEAVLVLPATFVIACAFAAILGMQMSLRCRTTVLAVMSSVGIVAGATGALGYCGYTLLNSSAAGDSLIALGMAAFSPFTLVTVLVNPQQFAGRVFDPFQATAGEIESARFVVFACAWIAVGVFAAVVWGMYMSMVKNFDMTIRKQSR